MKINKRTADAYTVLLEDDTVLSKEETDIKNLSIGTLEFIVRDRRQLLNNLKKCKQRCTDLEEADETKKKK